MIDSVRASDPRRRKVQVQQCALLIVSDRVVIVVDDRVKVGDCYEISKEHVDIEVVALRVSMDNFPGRDTTLLYSMCNT